METKLVNEHAYWLAWSQIKGIGPILLRRLQQEFGTLSEAWNAPPARLGQVEGLGRQLLETVVNARPQTSPEKLLASHLPKNPDFYTPTDSDYPRLLLEIPNPPPLLYYQGSLQPEELQGSKPMVGIVGTRSPSEYGKRWTRKLSAALAQQGFTVVSGMAAGIDTEAHRACLDAGGRTWAILGTGIDVVYPATNRSLYEAILQNGAVLSEYPAGTQPDRAHFPQRNRIIAGLCRAVLVMEAPTKSGALITAHLANDFGRDVYVLPGSLDNPNAMGCLGLLSKGAQLILSEGHLLDLLGAMPAVDRPNVTQLSLFEPVPVSPPPPPLPPELAQVFNAVTSEPLPLDLIVQTAQLPAGSVLSALLELELMGLVSQLPGMSYQRC